MTVLAVNLKVKEKYLFAILIGGATLVRIPGRAERRNYFTILKIDLDHSSRLPGLGLLKPRRNRVLPDC